MANIASAELADFLGIAEDGVTAGHGVLDAVSAFLPFAWKILSRASLGALVGI